MSKNSSAVSGHYNNLKESGLAYRNESRILYLRNFNNWIKSNLIQNVVSQLFDQFRSIDVIDLGSGKGGDQIKWAKAGVRHVSFLDIADVSVEQSKDRYRKGRFRYNADFFVRDFTEGFFDLLKERQYHLISCQFAFHYSFESYNQALNTLSSISKSLHSGGYFIGTTINALELVKRLKESQENEFSNELYKVTFDNEDKEKIKLFGEKYHFYLEGSVDCPEFLVYPPLFDKMAEDMGLKLVKRSSFPQFYLDNVKTENGRCLISRIKALQEFNVKDFDNILSEEFQEAKKYNDTSLYHKVLSISKSEWEIIQMYEVFIYQKV